MLGLSIYDLDLSYSPTKLYIPDNESKSLILQSFDSENNVSSSILSVDTFQSHTSCNLKQQFFRYEWIPKASLKLTMPLKTGF